MGRREIYPLPIEKLFPSTTVVFFGLAIKLNKIVIIKCYNKKIN